MSTRPSGHHRALAYCTLGPSGRMHVVTYNDYVHVHVHENLLVAEKSEMWRYRTCYCSSPGNTLASIGCGGHKFYNLLRPHPIDASAFPEVFWCHNDARRLEERVGLDNLGSRIKIVYVPGMGMNAQQTWHPKDMEAHECFHSPHKLQAGFHGSQV